MLLGHVKRFKLQSVIFGSTLRDEDGVGKASILSSNG